MQTTQTPTKTPSQVRFDEATQRNSKWQTSQIVENLRQRKQQIEKDEAEFRLRVWNWESSAATQQSALDQKQKQLEEKEAGLRQLQFQMLELQNQIIESQLALESIVSQVGQPTSPDDQLVGLISLRNELFQRFDFVEERWTQMINDLRLVARQITQTMQVARPVELD